MMVLKCEFVGLVLAILIWLSLLIDRKQLTYFPLEELLHNMKFKRHHLSAASELLEYILCPDKYLQQQYVDNRAK